MTEGARSGLRRAIPALATAAVVALLVAYLYHQRDHFQAHYDFSPTAAVGIGALVLASLALRAVANRMLFGRMGVAASYPDWFALVTVNSFSNYLPLSAGLVAKALYLKRVHSMPYGTFAVGQLALLILVVAANGAVGLATVVWWQPEHGTWVAAAFVAMAASGGLLYLPERATRRLAGRWFRWDAEAMGAVRAAAPGVVAVQVAILLATAWSLQLGFSMGDAQVGLAACLVFSASTVVTRLVSITPGALGVREFLVGGLAVLTGFAAQDAVIASTLTRLAEMLVIFSLGAVFTYTLTGRVAETYD